jgi:hypothetical protein
MKKYCIIVYEEWCYGITLLVDEDFDEDGDSEILKGVLRDFPKGERRIIVGGEEIMVMSEGSDIKIGPKYYLNKSGNLEKLN